MTSELSNFAARLREFILSEGRVPRAPDFEIPSEDGDSCNSSLRKDAAFNALALKLFTLQFAHNAPYRQICEARGSLPNNVRHWTEIPAVPAAAFKELELTCLSAAERTRVFHSSGTTKQWPSRHFHSAESLAVYEASAWSWFVANLLPDLKSTMATVRLAILTPSPAQAPHSSLAYMCEVVRRELDAPDAAFVGLTSANAGWSLDFEGCLSHLRRTCETGQPLVILGTAFSVVDLLDYLAAQNLRVELPTGSRIMETGGYKGRSRSLPKAELHAFITEQLGVPSSHIVCEYGMSELSSQAYDSAVRPKPTSLPVTRHFHFPPWARVQIVSPETSREVSDGETGLIRVFDLANVFSVMAIQTEDLGIRRGDGFELIGRAALAEPRGCSLMAV